MSNVGISGESLLKTKMERVKETVTLLRKIKELGIFETDPGYMEIKRRLDAWIAGGDAWTGTVELMRYGRRAYMKIPVLKGQDLECRLRSTE